MDRKQTIAESFAEFLLVDLHQTPTGLLEKMNLYVFDTLGVILAGTKTQSSIAITSALMTKKIPLEATVAGYGKFANACDAALINGTYAHSLELDDDHKTAVLHPGAVVIPAALAACELNNATGITFLRSVLGGYEIMCRLGIAYGGSQFLHGIHPTAVLGVFGATAASSVALGLDFKQTVNAFGIAGTQASGLTEWREDGSWIKRLHTGKAAQSGVLSAKLAKYGFTGPSTIFEGKGGFFNAFSYGKNIDRRILLDDLGINYCAFDTAIKPYPCCRFMHGAIDMAIQAFKEGLDLNAIVSVDIGIYETKVLTYHQAPKNTVDAQFNVPFNIALALINGAINLSDFTDTKIRDPELLKLSKKIRIQERREFSAAYPNEYQVEMIICLSDGSERIYFNDCPSGDPAASRYMGDRKLLIKETKEKLSKLLAEKEYGSNYYRILRATDGLIAAKNINKLTESLN